MSESSSLPTLSRLSHAGHCNRCMTGLPPSQIEADTSRIAIGFYCLGTLDLLDLLTTKTSEEEREGWRKWLWEQQSSGVYGTGFKPSSYMTPDLQEPLNEYSEYDTPHLIMTYTAILSLAILRDDFSNLDRKGIIEFLKACQKKDGSFSSLPLAGESDLRSVYCAFAISSMLNDWSGIDLEHAVAYIRQCISQDGGFGQSPHGEALGGTTYCAIAALYLVPLPSSTSHESLYITPEERARTIRWLVQNQQPSGGFSGRTNKVADACYCFWCGVALHILGVGDLVDSPALASFLAECQFKFGGISKAPEARPDPYHTYLSLAALAVFPPPDATANSTWKLSKLDPLLNATEETSKWIRDHVPGPQSEFSACNTS